MKIIIETKSNEIEYINQIKKSIKDVFSSYYDTPRINHLDSNLHLTDIRKPEEELINKIKNFGQYEKKGYRWFFEGATLDMYTTKTIKDNQTEIQLKIKAKYKCHENLTTLIKETIEKQDPNQNVTIKTKNIGYSTIYP